MNKKIKLYLCGPVTGIANNNLPQFRFYQEKFTALGYEVIVPHDLDASIDNDLKAYLTELEWKEYVWRQYMKVCIPEVVSAHLLVTLPSWSESRGSKIEVNTARGLLIPVIHCVNVKHVDDFREYEMDNVMKVA